MSVITGRTWLFGDSIDTDIIIPARYLVLPIGEMKLKAMEPVRGDFASKVLPGDVIVAGRNFGCGSSREQAPVVLRELGIAGIVAHSFARIFFRNAINVGLPVVECATVQGAVREFDSITVDLESGKIRVGTSAEEHEGTRLPEFLLDIIEDGGLIPHLSTQRGGRRSFHEQ